MRPLGGATKGISCPGLGALGGDAGPLPKPGGGGTFAPLAGDAAPASLAGAAGD